MAYASFFPRRINMYVPSLAYVADESLSPAAGYKVYFGAPLALSTTYFANVVLSTTGVALTLQTSDGTLLNNGLVPGTSATVRDLWGRGLTLVGDGASTRTIAILGWDYLGQRMKWTGALNGSTPVPVTKAFQWIDSVVFGAAADTVSVSVGYSNTFGLPFWATSMVTEIKNDAKAANAGTFTAGVTTNPATATSGDTRGTYLPVTVIPDGTNTFGIVVTLRPGQLHGLPQAAS